MQVTVKTDQSSAIVRQKRLQYAVKCKSFGRRAIFLQNPIENPSVLWYNKEKTYDEKRPHAEKGSKRK